MFTKAIYIITIILLIISTLKNKEKSKMSLKKAWKSFENMLPQLLSVLFIIGLTLSIVSPEVISKVMGNESGIIGVVIGAVVGSLTLIPSFVAFPLAAALLESGAGIMQVSAFISTLMMVGIVTIPMEAKVFGLKASLIRNIMAFGLSFVIAIAMGVLV